MTTNGVMTNEAMRRCIEECLLCHTACLEAVSSALSNSAGAEVVQLLLDCADICRTSADFMLRGSEFHPRTCAICAEVCERCAQTAGRFSDDALLQSAADACRRCAESCRQMADMGVTSAA